MKDRHAPGHVLLIILQKAFIKFLLFSVVFCVFCGSALSLGDDARNSDRALEQCWQTKLSEAEFGQLAAGQSAVFVQLDKARVAAVELATGSVLWSAEPGGAIVSNLLSSGDTVIVATSAVSPGMPALVKLRSLSVQTGIPVWNVDLAPAGRVWLAEHDGLIVAASDSGQVSAIASSGGSVIWTTKRSPAAAGPVVGSDRVALPTTGGVQFLDVSNGQPVGAFSMPFASTAAAFVFDRAFLAGDDRGNLALFSSDGSPQWAHKNGARIASIAGTERGALVTSFDNFVYMLTRNGGVMWKRRLLARPVGAPAIVDDKAILMSSGSRELFVIDLAKGRIIDRRPLEGEAIGTAAIAERSLFVAADSSGRLTTFAFGDCPSR